MYVIFELKPPDGSVKKLIRREADDLIIPFDRDNKDYRACLEWAQENGRAEEFAIPEMGA